MRTIDKGSQVSIASNCTSLHSAVSINVVYQPVSKCLVEDGREEGASHPLNRQDSRAQPDSASFLDNSRNE